MELFGVTISKFDNNTDSQECNYIRYSTRLHQIKTIQILIQFARTYNC
jgi:hypothetical protein